MRKWEPSTLGRSLINILLFIPQIRRQIRKFEVLAKDKIYNSSRIFKIGFNLKTMRQARTQIRLTPQITIEMWEKQKGKCIYCERTMIARDKWLQPTIEHIVPRSEGWPDHHSNYCFACFKCNNWRGQMPVEQFLDGYRYWCQHNGDQPSTHEARKVRGAKRWYHGNLIKW